jgi:xanthine dehydrogenase accessory factor
MKEIKFWETILYELEMKRNVVLCTVLQSELSSPGKAGFKMAVFENGNTIGTIGGGVMEYNIISTARNYQVNREVVNEILKLIHSEYADENKSGLICEGKIIINIRTISNSNVHLIEKIVSSIKENKPIALRLNSSGLEVINSVKNEKIFFNYSDDKQWIYEEILSLNNMVYIFGAGHVGLAVAKIFNFLNFYVKIFDDRQDILNNLDNSCSDEKILCDFSQISDLVHEGKNSFAIIVTRGHSFDKVVLRQLLNKNLAYLGMMGSKSKVSKIFSELRDEGVSPEILKKVHSPIGLSISSQTPEEIAVSIAAEVIKIKNENFVNH